MKKILFFLFLIFISCKREVQVEKLNATVLQEDWCIDLPKDILQYQQYHFTYGDNIYFITDLIGHIALYKVNKTSRQLSKIPIDWESVGAQSSYPIRYLTAKWQDGNLYLGREKTLFLFDLKNEKIRKLAENVSFFEISEKENLIYTLHQTSVTSTYEFQALNTQTLDNEVITNFKTESYIENVHIFKTQQGEELAFISTFENHFLCDIKKKKIIREQKINREIDPSNRMLLFQSPYAISSVDKFYKFDMKTGAIAWSLGDVQLSYGYHKLTLDKKNEKIFLLKGFDKVQCIDANNGKTIWEISFGVIPNNQYQLSFRLEIFLLNEVLYVTNGERLLMFDPNTGKEIGRQMENFMLGYPSIVDEKNNLIYTFKDGQLCALKGLK